MFVSCKTQAQVDRLWERLSKGGKKGQCGWLTDRYGLSWQIVPEVLGELMADSDEEEAARVSAALMKMRKLDISQLKRAHRGR
jgi:predicted 3-demethylubiquinone-9 3-methyltransferase (glyoxalase superfamily)